MKWLKHLSKIKFKELSLNNKGDSRIARGNRILSAHAGILVLAFWFLSMPAAAVSCGLLAFVFLVLPVEF